MTVRDAIERERARVVRLRLLTAAGGAIAVTLLLLVGGAMLLGGTRWLTLPRPVPFLVWGLTIGANVLVVAIALRRIRRASMADIAERIETEQQLRAGIVRGALEIADTGALGRRAAKAVATDLAGRGDVLAPELQRTEHQRARFALGAACAAIVATTVAVPAFRDGVRAILFPASAYAGSLLPALGFQDVPTDVLRGEPLRITVSAPGRTTVTLRHRASGSAWQDVQVDVRDGQAVVDLGTMRTTVQLVAHDGRSRSDTATIAVTDRPFIGGVTMRAMYPAYLGRPAETLPAGGRVQVPRGTVLQFSGRASVALARVALASASDTIEMRASGHVFDGRLVAHLNDSWSWEAESGPGAPSVDVPEPLILEVMPDSVPVADLMAPAADTMIAPGQALALRIGAADDHGLASVSVDVQIERAGAPGPMRRQLVVARPGTSWEGGTIVEPTGAVAGDVLHIRALAIDASPWAQTGVSRVLRVRVLTAEERRELARTLADSTVAQAVAAARAQRTLVQRTEDAARTRDRATVANSQGRTPAGTAMSEDAAERARTIAQEQRQLAERVEALRDAAKQLEKSFDQAGAMDSSLARRLRDAQELMRQALSPELMEKMQALEQAAQNLSGAEAQQALRDLAEMQQRMREQLEQSAEMLKRAAHEGAMQTLSDEAREIAEQQRALADSAAKGRADATRRAQDLADRSERYAEDVRELEERLARDRATAAAEGTAEARESAQRAEERLRESVGERGERSQRGDANGAKAEQRSGQRQGADAQTGDQQRGQQRGQQSAEQRSPGEQAAAQQSPGQQSPGQQPSGAGGQQQIAQGARDAASQMDRAAQAMQAARDAQVKEWKQELTQELDRAVQEMLQMAREERALGQQARDGQAGSEQLRGRQSSVQQGVDQTRQRLQEAGRRSSLLSGGSQRAVADARDKVQAATREMSQSGQGRTPQQAADALTEAAEALDRAAASLARDRQRAGNASSASGFAEMMQQLQEMAQRQGSINSQAQSIMQMPGGQQSAQTAQMARALARQQRQVAQGLDDIGEEAGGGRTGELAREARALAEALDAGRLDPRTAARQEQLFKRLLDAGRSLEKEEREDGERREARAAIGAPVFTPENTDASGREARRFREPTWEEMRGLSVEERRAILEYFRRINAGGTQ